jgi:EAL and modified HD-GYP domain-containing signal transduction protein
MVLLTLVRAKMCELLAVASGQKSPENYFTAGLISAIDIIMERELPELIEPLPLTKEIKEALLHHKGAVGEALSCVLAYEVSDFDNAVFQQLDANDIMTAQVGAIDWANTIIDSL